MPGACLVLCREEKRVLSFALGLTVGTPAEPVARGQATSSPERWGWLRLGQLCQEKDILGHPGK